MRGARTRQPSARAMPRLLLAWRCGCFLLAALVLVAVCKAFLEGVTDPSSHYAPGFGSVCSSCCCSPLVFNVVCFTTSFQAFLNNPRVSVGLAKALCHACRLLVLVSQQELARGGQPGGEVPGTRGRVVRSWEPPHASQCSPASCSWVVLVQKQLGLGLGC